MPASIVHLSAIAGSPLLDSAGDRLGRITDVVARLDLGDTLPPVVGLKVRIGGREMFVPTARIAALESGSARTATTKLDLRQFERRPGEVLLVGDVLDRSLINVTTAHLVTAREVDLVCDDGAWRVAGIDPTWRARLRRLMPRRSRVHDAEHDKFVPWTELEAFVGHVPSSRLKLAGRRLVHLHPAQIADLVEAASHREGEEILEAVRQNKELEADVFEELDDEHQVEFLRERSDAEAASVLARMETDDAADLLLELDQERRLPILNLLPSAKQRKIRSLLGHNPSTAGGIMNPDFIAVSTQATVAEGLARVRSSDLGPQQAAIVCVVDDSGILAGTLSFAALIRSEPNERLCDLIDETPTPAISVDGELPEVARLMADFNLIALSVLDTGGRPVGIIAVDDVLELLVPEEWRRRAGMARD